MRPADRMLATPAMLRNTAFLTRGNVSIGATPSNLDSCARHNSLFAGRHVFSSLPPAHDQRSCAGFGGASSMQDFHLGLSDLSFVGKDLSRPESVVATASGDVFTSDTRGGVTYIRPDGSQTLIGGPHLPAKGLHPNGIALMKDGSFLFANSGTGEAGGVWRLHRNGQVEPFLLEVDGVTLPRTHFVWLDDADRIWVCVSTVHRPNSQYSKDRPDGFIAMVDHRGARIAGTGIVWTNECRIDPSCKYLYFNETFAFAGLPISPRGGRHAVGQRRSSPRLGPGNFPDGLTFDEQGGAWITCIVSNRSHPHRRGRLARHRDRGLRAGSSGASDRRDRKRHADPPHGA